MPGLLVVMLLFADVAMIVVHLTHKSWGYPRAWFYDLGADHSWGELYLYLKWVWIAFLALVIWRRYRASVFLAFSAICFVLFIEDSMKFRERISRALVYDVMDRFPIVAGRPLVAMQAIELVWLSGVTLGILLLFGVGWWRTDRQRRSEAFTLALFFALFAFVSVVIDTWHSFYDMGTLGDILLTTIEDGGEVFSMSPAVAYAFWLARRSLEPTSPG